MKTVKLNSNLFIKNVQKFIDGYGLRSYNLWKLAKSSERLGYNVPESFLISSDLSIESASHFDNLGIQLNKTQNYLHPDNVIFQCYHGFLSNNKKELVEIAKTVDDGIPPIIRGTSCAEGFKNLSFAGVCHSFFPKKDLSFEENTFNGFAKVLSSIYSPYAQYYFQSHDIPENGKNIGIIMMKVLEKPLFHVTAYVYRSVIRVKYFFTPQTGTLYKGGGDVFVNTENESMVLKSEFGQYEEIWKHTFDVLRQLPSVVYDDSCSVDVEFLITKNGENLNLNIVQIRKISDVHLRNYEMSAISLPLKVEDPLCSISINKSYLYHSVIDCLGEINVSSDFKDGYMSEYSRVFVVKHQLGKGLFSFLSSLPRKMDKKIGLIVTHPNERCHDHLQYSVYEDDRVEFVVHVNEELTSGLKDGIIVHMISNGDNAIIKEVNEFSIENINIRFVDENSLPDVKTVSAVFLLGYIDNKIITGRNERGWDIPGGHVDPSDSDLVDALKREADEESGTIVGNVKPFAVVQFKGKEKVMLFYTSNDCKLVEFIPKEDALERELMAVPDFISKYNWRKDVIELLIKRSLLVLGN